MSRRVTANTAPATRGPVFREGCPTPYEPVPHLIRDPQKPPFPLTASSDWPRLARAL
jgi:hypothetical protein